ncbi:MAG: rhomboid family intramembrane serine protease, partial [Myxococcales bacterium]
MGPVIRLRTDGGEQELELEEFEARVRRGEVAGHCPVNFPPVTGGEWVRADSLDLFRALHQPRKLYFARAFNLGRFPQLTALFIILDVALYMVMSLEGPVDDDTLILYGAKVAPLILDLGEYWRLLTANLVHKDRLHIAFNLFVLFNVGGALENVYRPLDYLWLLFVSAVGASLTSLVAMPDAQSAGASGIVYGTLGGIVTFGLRYRDLLPARYRSILGDAVIPVVVVFLFIGFTSAGVDNWAHIGGLVSGAVAALFLKPRLLVEERTTAASSALRIAPMLGVVALLAVAGTVAPALTEVLVPERDDAFGVEAAVPRFWRRGTDRFGQIAYYNGLPGVGRASLSAQAQLGEPGRPLEKAVEDYIERHLKAEERAGAIRDVAVHPPMSGKLAGRRGLVLRASYADEGVITFQKAWFLPRGDFVYQLVFQWSGDFPAYEPLLDRMADRVRFFEPRALREARARALLAPGAAEAQTVL